MLLTLLLLEFLNQEIKGILRLGNNQFLEEALHELEDLLFLQV